eukprot:m.299280 g.299280  ORF g.299280 m.299280 type:complete len:514 (-) comp19546_c0_seq7:279-1820(-)
MRTVWWSSSMSSAVAWLVQALTTLDGNDPVARVRVYNILVHGVAFMVLFSAFQTASEYSQPVLSALGHGDLGFLSASVIYGVFSVSTLISPHVVTYLGPRLAMCVSGLTYVIFIFSFVFPSLATILAASAILGVGAAVLWTAQGVFLTRNSTEADRGRLSGVFWAMLQARLIIGNAVALHTTGDIGQTMSADQARRFFVTMCVIGSVGTACFALLRRSPPTHISELPSPHGRHGPSDTSVSAVIEILRQRDMVAVSAFSAFTGLLLTFWSGKFFTIMTGQLEPDGLKLPAEFQFSAVAKAGFAVAGGEIAGGLCGGWAADRFGRSRVVYASSFAVAAGLLIVAQQMVPSFGKSESSVLLEVGERGVRVPCKGVVDWTRLSRTCVELTRSLSCMQKASVGVMLFAACLLGLGDAASSTVLYGLLGARWPDQATEAFAVMKMVQSVAAATAFAYSGKIVLFWQVRSHFDKQANLLQKEHASGTQSPTTNTRAMLGTLCHARRTLSHLSNTRFPTC